jgi:AcrR family transcriptional regulator
MSNEHIDTPARLVAAMLECAAEHGWRSISLDEVGARVGLSSAETYSLCADKAQLLDLFARWADAASVADAGEVPDNSDARYDALLDILMQRFEVLEPYKHAVAKIVRDVAREPDTLVRILPQSQRSFMFLARAAGFPHEGLRGHMFAKALSGVWLATQRVWLRDRTDDLSETMAALDRNLRRAVEMPIIGVPELRRAEEHGE